MHEARIDFYAARVLPGGCFFANTEFEYNARPGPVRDRLAAASARWITFLERLVREAVELGELPTDATAAQPTAEFGHVEHVQVHFDDLDAMGILHNARYAVLLERALTPYWTERGIAFHGDLRSAPDVFQAVREFNISYRAPQPCCAPPPSRPERPGGVNSGPLLQLRR